MSAQQRSLFFAEISEYQRRCLKHFCSRGSEKLLEMFSLVMCDLACADEHMPACYFSCWGLRETTREGGSGVEKADLGIEDLTPLKPHNLEDIIIEVLLDRLNASVRTTWSPNTKNGSIRRVNSMRKIVVLEPESTPPGPDGQTGKKACRSLLPLQARSFSKDHQCSQQRMSG